MASATYVYAIAGPDPALPAGVTGLGGAALSVVTCRALAAITSPVGPGELRPTAEQVLRHEAAVEAVRRLGPALPVRFGTVLSGAEAVERALAGRYDLLAADLARLGDKVELGLTVLWGEQDSGASEAGSGRRVPDQDDGSPGAHGPGARFLLARLAEQRREGDLRARAGAVVREVDRALGARAIAQRRTILPVPRMAVRAAYLLAPPGLPAFREAFEALRADQPGLRFLLTGPWPPYSFVSSAEPGDRAGAGGQLVGLARRLAGNLLLEPI